MPNQHIYNRHTATQSDRLAVRAASLAANFSLAAGFALASWLTSATLTNAAKLPKQAGTHTTSSHPLCSVQHSANNSSVADSAWANVCGIFQVDGSNPAVRSLAALPNIGLLRKALASADILILGEVHDNALHHRLQAAVLADFARVKAKAPSLVMEHIRSDQQPALNAYLSTVDRHQPRFWRKSAANLGPALNWKNSRWPQWAVFQPIAEAALRIGAPILAGNVTRQEIVLVARQGLKAIPQSRQVALHLNVPLPRALQEALLDQLEASHCNLLPRTVFGNMAAAQRLRDAQLAQSAVAAAHASGSTILLTGNGHARTDRGAAWYIKRMAPTLRVVSIVLVEVSANLTAPKDHVPKAPDGRFAADMIVLTPKPERADPCIKMRARFSKKR